MSYSEQITIATHSRNHLWEENQNIPSWVDIDNVGLDQFFTVPEVAEYCHKNMLSLMISDGASERNYKFIEPSAGAGVFLDLLPKDRRLGIDIMPLRSDIEQHDFLSWLIKPNCLSYATIGNPPFGYRAWLALAFINHAATFSDYVGMILPMAFQSDGKGSPKHRVKGLELLHANQQGKAQKGFWRLKFTSRKDRFAAKLKGMKQYLRKNLNATDTHAVIRVVIRVIRGWLNYHAITDNRRRVGQFREKAKGIIHRWLNRRGGKRYVSWAKLIKMLEALDFPQQVKIKSLF